MRLPEDFREFIELMIESAVEFVMIGGYAYNLYRNPRATGDIDFLVAVSSDNERRMRKVLEDFGFGSAVPDTTLLKPGEVIMLGRAPFRIDLLTDIAGVTFQEARLTCRYWQMDTLAVPVISPEMLLRNKQAAGRPQDLADVEQLSRWLDDTSFS